MLMEAWEQKHPQKSQEIVGCDVPGMICRSEATATFSESIDNLTVPSQLRDLLMENDPKYTTAEEMAHIMGDEDASITIPLSGDADLV